MEFKGFFKSGETIRLREFKVLLSINPLSEIFRYQVVNKNSSGTQGTPKLTALAFQTSFRRRQNKNLAGTKQKNSESEAIGAHTWSLAAPQAITAYIT